MSAASAFLALNIRIHVGMGVVIASLCVASLGAASTINRTWISTQKWAVLRAFPIRETILIRQTALIAAGVLALDVACPITLFAALSADRPDAGEICCAALFGVGSAMMSVLALSATTRRTGATLLVVLLASAALGTRHAGIGAVLIVVSATAGLVVVRDLGIPLKAARHVAAGSSILLGELRSSTMALANTIGLVVMSAVFTATMIDQGVPSPLGMAVVTANTPLNSYFSRNPGTYSVIVAAPRSDMVFARYYLGVCVFYALSEAPAGIMLIRAGTRAFVVCAESAVCAAAAALVAWMLERLLPVTSWKSEREVLRHPRKYLPPVAGLVAVTLGMLAASLT